MVVRNIDQDTITPAVIASIAGCSDERLHTIVAALVRHLHDFSREVRLSESEWVSAIRFLTDVGHITDAKRQEFILLSDVLGLSMLVTAQNNAKPPGCTESTVLGPFFVEGAPEMPLGSDIAQGAPGTPCLVSGRVRGLGGEAVPGAVMEVWQSDAEGFYDVQRALPNLSDVRGRARLRTDAQGGYHFRSILAHCYPIPHDGPVGAMLKALGRHPWRPAHLHFMIHAPGYQSLTTHVFRDGGQYLEEDAVFGVRSSLVADWVYRPASPEEAEHYTLHYDFVLNPDIVAR